VDACPDIETLGAFVEGAIVEESARRVEAHVSACERCYDLVAELLRNETDIVAGGTAETVGVVNTVTSLEPAVTRGRFGRRVWAVSAGAALASAAMWVLLVRPSAPESAGAFEALVAAVGDERTVEGRLTGGFQYGRLRSPVRSGTGPRTDNLSLLSVAGELQRANQANRSADSLHVYGVAQLLLGQRDEAIATLEEAASRSATARPALLADLAAAYLSRATDGESPEDLPRALEEAERAIELDGSLLEPRFTKAIVLERLGLHEQAARAWDDYLALDPSSAWAEEARARSKMLQRPSSRVPVDEIFARARNSDLTQVDIDLLTTDYRDEVPDLLLGEVLAVALNASATSPDSRESAIAVARQVAASMARHGTRSPLLAAVTGAFEHLRGDRSLEAPLRDLATGSRLLREDRYAAAEAHVTRALRLAPRWPLLAGWAQWAVARVRYFEGRYDEASNLLDAVETTATAVGDAALRSRALWTSGLVAFSSGRWTAAEERYRAALDGFLENGEQIYAANVRMNLAILSRFLGDRRRAWDERLRALAATPWHRPGWAHSFLITAAISSSLDQHPRAALAFMTEAVRNAERGVPAHTRAEALVQRARLHARSGNRTAAAADLHSAAAILAHVNDQSVAIRVGMTLDVARAELFRYLEPAVAIDAANRVIATSSQRSDYLRSAEAHLYLGQALRTRHDRQGARQAFENGIRDFERVRASVSAANPVRLSAFEPVWDLFDESFALSLLDASAGRQPAFAAYERARARTLLDAHGRSATTLSELQSKLGPGTAVLLLHQRPESLLAWLIRSGRDEVRDLPLDMKAAGSLTDSVIRSIQGGEVSDAAELYDRTLAPFTAALADVTEMIIVPDGPLVRVPWTLVSARGDPTESRWSVSVAPSAAWMTTFARAEAPPASVAAFGVGAASERLPAIPNVRREVEGIAKLYAVPLVRLGSEVTPELFLRDAASADVIHVAAHALDNSTYPTLSRLLLAPGLGGVSDLTVERIVRELRLRRNPIVVLAACSTVGVVARRGEGSIGLAWAFMAAGARAVVATLWEIDDMQSVELFEDLHRELVAGAAVADALKRAQIGARRRGVPAAVWGALQLVGWS
jgi:CHAT domain-containing protein